MDLWNCSAPAEAVRRELGFRRRALGAILGVALAALLPACSLLHTPQQVVTAVIPAGKPQFDPVELQLQLQRFADDFAARQAAAVDDYAQRVGTEAARVDALRLKLNSSSSVLAIASGPNPSANLLDMVSVATLTRMTIEDHWITTTNGPACQPWLEASRVMETNIWAIAATILKAPQIDELRNGIRQWYERHPEAHTAFFARPEGFVSMVKNPNAADSKSVFSWVNLDPTAGLDPAVREVTRTRLFAERAMWTAQRMPFPLRMQMELLAHELTRQSEIQGLLTNTTRLSDSADRISHAVESVSQTAAQLPDRVTAERKAILEALDQQEGKLHDLAAEVNRSLVSADKMSASLSIAITNFDALMKRFGVGEPSTDSSPPDTNTPPFNILDYGKTADHISGMAKEVNTLLTTVNQSMPQLAQVSQQAGADAQKVVDHAFRLGLLLIGVLLAGSVFAALLYRLVAARLTRSHRQTPTPN
jgi:hypothetical protein